MNFRRVFIWGLIALNVLVFVSFQLNKSPSRIVFTRSWHDTEVSQKETQKRERLVKLLIEQEKTAKSLSKFVKTQDFLKKHREMLENTEKETIIKKPIVKGSPTEFIDFFNGRMFDPNITREIFQYLPAQHISLESDQMMTFLIKSTQMDSTYFFNHKIKEILTTDYYVVHAPSGMGQLQDHIEYLKYYEYFNPHKQRTRFNYEDTQFDVPLQMKMERPDWHFVVIDKKETHKYIN